MATKAMRTGAVELALIVVGVLAAFALEAWWSDSLEARQNTESLRAIRDEFEEARAILQTRRDNHGYNVESFTTLKDMLSSGRADLPADTILLHSMGLWWAQPYSPAMPAYAGFVAAGRTSALKQDSLRNALFAYELALEEDAYFDDYLMTSMTTSWEPALATRIPHLTSEDDMPVALQMMMPPEELARDLTFVNLVWVRLNVERELERRRTALLAQVDEILRLLDRQVR